MSLLIENRFFLFIMINSEYVLDKKLLITRLVNFLIILLFHNMFKFIK